MDASSLPISRREARREARREVILDVAERCFMEHGYAGTTMSAIAAELGGSKGTLWSYFPSKEQLFEAVVDRSTSSFRAQILLALDPAEDVETALRRFCLSLLRRICSVESLALHRLVMGEVNRFPELGRIFYDHGYRPMHELLAAFLESAMARGRLRRDDPLIAARQLVALCVANGHQQRLTGKLDRTLGSLIERDATSALDTFMRAFALDYRPAD